MLGTKTKIATLKIMVFKVRDLSLGIRLESVQKVITMPKIHKGSNSFLGITQVDDRELVVLDLYQTIYGADTPRDKGYFMVVKSFDQMYGLPSLQLPTMVEVPLADLHALPAQYRDRDILGIASQMAQVSLVKDDISTLFVLDQNCLAALVQQYDPETMHQEYEALKRLVNPVDDLGLALPSPDLEERVESQNTIEVGDGSVTFAAFEDGSATFSDLELLAMPEAPVEILDWASSTDEFEKLTVPQSSENGTNWSLPNLEFEDLEFEDLELENLKVGDLIDLQCPVDVLDQPILTNADPSETDFPMDFA